MISPFRSRCSRSVTCVDSRLASPCSSAHVIGWGWLVPHYSALTGDLTTAAGALAQTTWSHKVRFIGAGAIGVSAIWTLLKLVKPVASGLAGAMAASRARKAGKADTLPITERDIPIGIVGLVTLALHAADRLGARLLRKRERARLRT